MSLWQNSEFLLRSPRRAKAAKFTLVLLLGIVAMGLASCNANPTPMSCLPDSYTARYPTVTDQSFDIPPMVTDLYTLGRAAKPGFGPTNPPRSTENSTPLINNQSNRVLLIILGGPQLIDTNVIQIGGVFDNAFLPFRNHFTAYVVYQMNHIYSRQISALVADNSTDNRFTPELAQQINNQNSEILFRVARHFEQQGKEVYVYSSSYGSFLYSKFLERYPTENCLVTRAVSSVGRLKASTNILSRYREGFFTLHDISADNTVVDRNSTLHYNPFQGYIIGNVAEPDYTTIFTATNIYHDILWVASPQDRNVGPMSPQEIAFINNHPRFNYAQVNLSGNLRDIERISAVCPHGLGISGARTIPLVIDYLLDGSADAEINYTIADCSTG